jgi:two-component system NtrC family sensor kinase
MRNNSPIRVRITGGSSNDREQVRNVLREQAVPISQVDASAEVDDGVSPEVAACAIHRDEVVHADRTVAERAVRESQRLISIGRLSAEIVHEINNPLESVGNLLYLALHESGMPPRAIDFLRTAESELQRVVQISKQTLSFSRESSEPIALRVADLMDEVVTMYSRRMRQKQFTLVEDYATIEMVMALPGEIRQVFSNLVTNAIEACSKGGKIRLRIRDVKQTIGGIVQIGVRINVSDNGTGITESARKRLGEIFFTTKGESGTGLGLWVTKTIVARCGGNMRLHSSTGRHHGTVFSVFLPAMRTGLQGDAAVETDRKLQTSGNVTEISRHPSHAIHLQTSATLQGKGGGTAVGTKISQRHG